MKKSGHVITCHSYALDYSHSSIITELTNPGAQT